jgi:class 3 adenylate cyclase
MVPEVHWAPSQGAALAYQVVGSGDRDIVVMFSGISHLEVFWDLPENVDNINRLTALGRVILFDKRGVGLSDRPAGPASSLETYAADVVAVLDAADSTRAVLFSWLFEGTVALAVAARHPDRVEAVVAGELLATFIASSDHPWGLPPSWHDALPMIEAHWGEAVLLQSLAGQRGVAPDARLLAWSKRMERLAVSPSGAASLLGYWLEMDARPYLPDVRAPVLLLHDVGEQSVPEEGIRWLADHLPDARLRVVDDDRVLSFIPGNRMFDEVEEFLTGHRSGGGRDRRLCAVLVSDIAGSTEQLAAEGGDAWRRRLASHRRSVRDALVRHQGTEIDTAGDGFLITFPLPSRALACAQQMLASSQEDGVHLRVGVHAGEITVRDSGVTGLAVHIAARVAALAGVDQVLVTDTVALALVGVTGAPRFEDAGEARLKGVPDTWRLRRALL